MNYNVEKSINQLRKEHGIAKISSLQGILYTFKQYQAEASVTANYPIISANYIYPAIGLAGECGELLNKIKKIFRDDQGMLTEARIEQLSGELGDILWYIAELATKLNLPLERIALENIQKLQSRNERRKITGEGDNR